MNPKTTETPLTPYRSATRRRAELEAGNRRHKIYDSAYKETHQSRQEITRRRQEQVNKRRRKYAVRGGALALTATMAGLALAHGGTHEFTHEQLAKMPHKTAVIDPGRGPIEAVTEVDPNLAAADPQGTNDVENYIESEFPGGVVTPGQVKVPITPSDRHN